MQKTKFKKGIMFGIIVGVAWGLDCVFMGKIGEYNIFYGIATAPLIIAFLHDSFAAIWLMLFMSYKKKLVHTFKIVKTKTGKVTMLAALIGAPIGMSGYVLGINYAGASYASSISVIYPAIGALFAFLFLKERMSKFSVLGVLITIFGASAMGLTGAALEVKSTFLMGICFTLVAVIAWALEGTIIAFAMKGTSGENESAEPEQLLTLRYIVSALVYAVLIMPLINGYSTVFSIFNKGFLLGAFAFMGILGVITYLSWYKAVALVGGGLGTALNSTAAFWTVVFGFLLFKTSVSVSQIVWCLVIILGVFVFSLSSNVKK